jgi:hypothetical protein
MGRKKHPCGKAGTWIEVKVIKGRPYWYERTRVYLGAGKSRIKSKYLGPGPERTPESAAAELHESPKVHGQNQSPEQKESVAHKVHRLWDRLKNPACGLVDNASEDFYQAPAEIGSAQLTRRTHDPKATGEVFAPCSTVNGWDTLAAGKIKGLNPKSVDYDGGQTVPITLVTNRQK